MNTPVARSRPRALLHWVALSFVASGLAMLLLSRVKDGVEALKTNNHTGKPRIVSLVAGVTETITSLGAEDTLVSGSYNRSASTTRDTGGKPRLYTSERSGMTNAEGILSLNPDYVFAPRELMRCIEGRGLNVVHVPQDTFSDMRRFVMNLGTILKMESKARDLLSRMDEKILTIRRKTEGLPRVRVYFEDGQLGRTRGPGTAVHEMIELAGGKNIYQDGTVPRATISIETILAADPEVIIVPATVSLESLRERQGFENVSAIRNGRVHSLDPADRAVTLYTPSCAIACERTFLRWFHPELFELNVEK